MHRSITDLGSPGGFQELRILVRKAIRTSQPVLHYSRSVLRYGNKCFQIRPDEAYEFNQGHLVIEYERMKRPVESISKYWWLFYRSNWPKNKRRIVLVLFLLNKDVDKIRIESANLLGKELEKRFPDLFSFFCAPPTGITTSKIRTMLKMAVKKVR